MNILLNPVRSSIYDINNLDENETVKNPVNNNDTVAIIRLFDARIINVITTIIITGCIIKVFLTTLLFILYNKLIIYK